MIIKTESEKLEEQFWKNRPIYTIWGYEEDFSAEKLFSSKSVEETKSKMLDIIQNGYVYPYVSYGISLGSAENFDFYTYKPHDEPVFDIEAELLNMENSLDCNTYTLYGFKESTIEKLFETQDIGKIKKKMREVIVNTVKSDAKPEYLHYSVCVNDSPCYDFDSNEIYEKKERLRCMIK